MITAIAQMDQTNQEHQLAKVTERGGFTARMMVTFRAESGRRGWEMGFAVSSYERHSLAVNHTDCRPGMLRRVGRMAVWFVP